MVFIPPYPVAVSFFPDQLNQPIDSEVDFLSTPFFNYQPPDCEQLFPTSSGFTWLPANIDYNNNLALGQFVPINGRCEK
jgi:hypothetical protein